MNPSEVTGEIETAARLNAKQAARMLGVGVRAIRHLVQTGKLARYGTHNAYWHRSEDVEVIAREPRRIRRQENSERRTALRLIPPAETPPERVMIDSDAAREILGVCVKTLYHLINTGQLLSYQRVAKSTPHRFDRAEVERLGDRRAAAKKAPRPPKLPSRRPHYIVRERLQCGKRIGVGDLPAQDKYFFDWVNARQAAWLLSVTMGRVYRLRDSGQIRAMKDPTVAPRNCLWLFNRADIKRLINEPEFMDGRFHYEQHCSPAARKRKQAEREREAEIQFRQQLDACEAASARAPAVRGSEFAANLPDF